MEKDAKKLKNPIILGVAEMILHNTLTKKNAVLSEIDELQKEVDLIMQRYAKK